MVCFRYTDINTMHDDDDDYDDDDDKGVTENAIVAP
jgi:hypothetical protein